MSSLIGKIEKDDVALKKLPLFKLSLNLKSLKACKECLVISGQRDHEDHQRNQLFLLDKSVKKTKISHGWQVELLVC